MLYNTLFQIFGSLMLSQVRTQNTTLTPLEDKTQSSETTTVSYYYDIPIYALHYNISEEGLSNLAFELLIQEQFLSILSTPDVLNLLQSRHLVVGSDLLDIDFAKIMKNDVPVTALLQKLIIHVPDKKYQNMKNIANNFNIDFSKYQEYFMEQDEENLYNLLSGGNYTQETIEETLAIMKTTEQNIVNIVTAIALEYLQTISIKAIATQYQEQLEDLLVIQGVPAGEIMSHETFNSMLNTFKNLLNSEIFWTTAIAPASLVSVLNASLYAVQYSPYIQPYLINIENHTNLNVSSITLNNTFTVINPTKELESYIIMKYNPKRFRECYCIVADGLTGVSVLVPKNITHKKNLILTENDGCARNYGSPLICQKQLYGILTMWDEDRLAYQTFSEREDEEIPNVMPPLVDLVDSGVGAHNLWVTVCLLVAIHVIVINS